MDERQPDVNVRGISDERDRLLVVMMHNTDIPDTWEREGESQAYFERFSPNGYAVGVNVVLYRTRMIPNSQRPRRAPRWILYCDAGSANVNREPPVACGV